MTMNKTPEFWNGYEIGYEAYQNEANPSNPFHLSSDEYAGWNAGYNASKSDNG